MRKISYYRPDPQKGCIAAKANHNVKIKASPLNMLCLPAISPLNKYVRESVNGTLEIKMYLQKYITTGSATKPFLEKPAKQKVNLKQGLHVSNCPILRGHFFPSASHFRQTHTAGAVRRFSALAPSSLGCFRFKLALANLKLVQ